MSCAVCFCPDFIAKNIRDINIFTSFFLGTLMNDDHHIILDTKGRLQLIYLRSCQQDKDAFYLYKKWEGALADSTPGKVLLTQVQSMSDDVRDIIVSATMNAPTTFDKHIFVFDNANYSSYLSELIRQHISLLNSSNISLISNNSQIRTSISISKFDSDLCWVIQRLGRRSGKGNCEDDFNDFIRDMLLAKNYEVKDQTREGQSQSGKQAGELDLIIEDKGSLFAIIEALILSAVDKQNIQRHFSKLLSNYNPLMVKRLFMVTYYVGTRFDDWFEKYFSYLMELTPAALGLLGHEMVSIKEKPTSFIGLKKVEQHFSYAGQHYFCIHYAVKMPK
ncbi:TPA: hypothetical protein L9M15_004525 [Klebsiella quasipneumoniae subsp. similipneumoniae]|jgi:hypothetical protein|nr:hypothetical protein [Klebsiella quasipneumoniae subsp. similipneumoniae]HBR1732940.1 hypothetical protein [Klebsiella quasipneumoniae subsp. similipneumoniae]HBR1769904.1 hypothetical protein [Klebsiella quasipneumoniae subsp. similipneumoniae]